MISLIILTAGNREITELNNKRLKPLVVDDNKKYLCFLWFHSNDLNINKFKFFFY